MKTAMQIMLDELMAHEYTIPLELIVKCKDLIVLENDQINDAYFQGFDDNDWDSLDDTFNLEYYKQTYESNP
jgi:hypothetical protein